METRTIPEDEWIAFADRFSQEHAGWVATVQVLEGQRGPLLVADGMPLQGISFDTRARARARSRWAWGRHRPTTSGTSWTCSCTSAEADEPDGSVDLQDRAGGRAAEPHPP
jgi:hypothetical protein